jgi:hypothetical protein
METMPDKPTETTQTQAPAAQTATASPAAQKQEAQMKEPASKEMTQTAKASTTLPKKEIKPDPTQMSSEKKKPLKDNKDKEEVKSVPQSSSIGR